MARSTYFRREATVNDHTYGLPTAVVDSTALEAQPVPSAIRGIHTAAFLSQPAASHRRGAGRTAV